MVRPRIPAPTVAVLIEINAHRQYLEWTQKAPRGACLVVDMLPSLFIAARSRRHADMMTSSAFGSGMAMGVMAWPSRKRSSFLVSVASSTMAKCGARERLAICRA